MDILNLGRSEVEKNEILLTDIFSFLKKQEMELIWKSNFKQILYNYVNKIFTHPKCHCGNLLNFKSSRVGYRKNCSQKCSANSEITKTKLAETKLLKYGDPKYNNLEKNKRTKLLKYGNENYNNREKAFETNVEKYGYHSATKNNSIKEKIKHTKKERYGCESFNNSEKTKVFWQNLSVGHKQKFVEKVKSSKYFLYGDENYNNSKKMVETKVLKGILRDEFSNLQFKDYKNRVRARTNTRKKELFAKWDGLDFYTGENISEFRVCNYTHPSFPTIDHKVPIVLAYKLGMSVEECSDLSNLCITQRKINSKKKDKVFEDFIQILSNQMA